MRIIAKNIRSFCTGMQKVKIPQLEQGDRLCQQGKYSAASACYSRVVQIMNSVKMNEKMDDQYVEGLIKLAASLFIGAKTGSIDQLFRQIDLSKINVKYSNYLTFLQYSNKYFGSDFKQFSNNGTQTQAQKQIHQIVKKLASKTPIQALQINQKINFPLLRSTSNILNNSLNYQKGLLSLIERSPKSQKSQKPQQQLEKLQKSEAGQQTKLLFLMSKILENKSLKTSDKQFINNQVNELLKTYQKSRQKQVYKPLLNIIMSLIGQKQYMSSQGMIGHIKTEEMALVNLYKSQDKNLINNIYRMLVTRANNQPFQVGWPKEEPVLFGDLVAERIIKAPLHGHTISNLIC